MDGIWPRAYIFSWPPMGDGFVSGRKAPHHLAPATQLPLMPWNVFSHLNSFAWNWNICLIKMTGNELCFLLVFILFWGDISQFSLLGVVLMFLLGTWLSWVPPLLRNI